MQETRPLALALDRIDLEYLKLHADHERIDLQCVALVDDKIKIVNNNVVSKYIKHLTELWNTNEIDPLSRDILKENNYVPSNFLTI